MREKNFLVALLIATIEYCEGTDRLIRAGLAMTGHLLTY